LIPMFVPAAMPEGRRLAASAVLLEVGALGIAISLALDRSPLPWVAFVVAALAVFLGQVRWIVQHKRPRPVELPPRDWSTWQTHVAILYVVVATTIGFWLAIVGGSPTVVWVYGATGLLGFVSQMVLGIAGRLLPMHAWYRAYERRDQLPPRSVHSLIAPSLAFTVFACWALGLPVLLVGILTGHAVLVATGAVTLVAGVVANGLHVVVLGARTATRSPGRQIPIPNSQFPRSQLPIPRLDS
jgi:hypothetical protein